MRAVKWLQLVKLFANVEQIVVVHTQLLAQLRQCITQNGGEPYYSRWCTAMRWLCALTRRAPAGCGIGQQFLLMVPFLKFYTEYLANYDDALATLTEWARGTIPIMQVSLRSSASSLSVATKCTNAIQCATPAEAVPVDPPAHLPVCAHVPAHPCVRAYLCACMHASPGGWRWVRSRHNAT